MAVKKDNSKSLDIPLGNDTLHLIRFYSRYHSDPTYYTCFPIQVLMHKKMSVPLGHTVELM